MFNKDTKYHGAKYHGTPSPIFRDYSSDPLESPGQPAVDTVHFGSLTRPLNNHAAQQAAQHAEAKAAAVTKAVVQWQKAARERAASDIVDNHGGEQTGEIELRKGALHIYAYQGKHWSHHWDQ